MVDNPRPAQACRKYHRMIQIGHAVAIQPAPEASPLLMHPLTSQLLSSIEIWIRQEPLGKYAAEELVEVRTASQENR